MRITCKDCGKWVKDKFIFGTLHICLTEAELAYKRRQERARARSLQQLSPDWHNGPWPWNDKAP